MSKINFHLATYVVMLTGTVVAVQVNAQSVEFVRRAADGAAPNAASSPSSQTTTLTISATEHTARSEVGVTAVMLERSTSAEHSSINVKSSEDLASDYINAAVDAKVLDVGEGWNEDSKVFVAVGTATAPIKNPRAGNDFIKIRSVKSIESSLLAKRSIIEYIRLNMKAEDLVGLPETGLGTEFDRQTAELDAAISKATEEFRAAIAEVDQARSAAARGVTVSELIREGTAAYIRKFLDDSFSIGKLEQRKRERLEAATANLQALEAQIQAYKKRADALRNSLTQENKSVISTFASMPLVGAMMVAQFESWKDGRFQITSVYTWSAKQEKEVRAIVAGRAQRGPAGSQSLGSYIRAHDWSTAIGGRKHLDDRGELHVLGIGAWPLGGGGSADRRAAEGTALRLAQRSVAFAMMGDTTVRSKAQVNMQERRTDPGKENMSEIQSSFAESLQESVEITLQGVQRRYGREVRNPISGQPMYVVVVSASASQAAIAKDLEKELFAAAASMRDEQARTQGTRSGLEEGLRIRAADGTAEAMGRAEGRVAVRPVAPAQSPTVPALRPEGAAGVSESSRDLAKPREQSVTGAGSSVGAFRY
jgi:hypothetical protein